MQQGKKIIIDDLTLLKSLGKGSYGEVFLTARQGKAGLCATKKMDRKIADRPNVAKYLKNEIAIMRLLNHKNIVKLFDVKVTKNHYYLVMEYCNGGSLSDCLKKYKQRYGLPFSEEIVQYLMRQIISAIQYIHNNHYIHRDLKLDNILVSFNSDADKNNLNMMKAIVKIIDFGFATKIDTAQLCYTALGSPINMDPHILKKMDDNKKGINYGNMVGYDQKADIWSLGTLCYEMLIGCSAFNSKTMQELVQKVESGNYQIPTHLSKEVISFLNAMLQYNGQKRLSANELARHHFLTKNVKDFSSIDLRKVSNKINRNNNLNVNIKRNNTIWSIFNEEDEKKLINIPCNYLLPITEEDEYNQSLTGNYINYNNNYANYPQDNIKQKNINNNVINNNNYQGYGAGYNGVEPYDISYTSGNYQAQLNNQVQVQYGDPFSGPVINVVEQETNTPFIFRGVKKGPIAELPSFGVPSPGEENNTETGYTFSSAVFQPDSKPDAKTEEI